MVFLAFLAFSCTGSLSISNLFAFLCLNADLKAGLATAPVLFAAEEYPELGPFMDRKFKEDGDVDAAVRLVFSSDGIERTKQLARVHAEYAMDAILEQLRPSEHRDSLIHLAHKVVARTK